jgi:hypothetical protein
VLDRSCYMMAAHVNVLVRGPESSCRPTFHFMLSQHTKLLWTIRERNMKLTDCSNDTMEEMGYGKKIYATIPPSSPSLLLSPFLVWRTPRWLDTL